MPSIDGLQERFEPGKTYILNLSYTGGPNPGPGAVAGFNLKVSAGELNVPKSSKNVRITPSAREATHTLEGNRLSKWQVEWRAPDDGPESVSITLVVNVVNGDGAPGNSDKWGRRTYTLENAADGGSSSGGFVILISIFAIILVLVAISFISKHRATGRSRSKSRRQQDRRRRRRRR
jgi:hypothetical protein